MLTTRVGLNRCIKQLIFSLLFWFGLPILYCVCIPLYLFRQILVKGLARHFHPDWQSMLNLRDNVFYEDLQNEGGLTNVLLLTVIGQGDPSIEKIRNFFRDYILNFKNYKNQIPYSKLQYYPIDWLGYPFWVKAKGFQIENHVKILDEFQGTNQVELEELEIFLGNYYMKPFPWKTPPWELLLVKNFVHFKNQPDQDSSKKFALIFRWQNSICDGSSIAKIFINVFGGDQHYHNVEDDFLNYPIKSNCFTLDNCPIAEGQDDQVSLWSNFKLYTSNLLFLGHDTLKSLMIDGDRNSWRVAPEILTNKCHLVRTNKLPLNVARTVSKKRKVSMTSVFFAALAGGIRQYFIETGQERRLPPSMRIRLCIPMSKYPCNRLTNHWSFANIKLPVGHSNAIERLERIEQDLEKFRTSFTPGFIWMLEPLLYSCLPTWLKLPGSRLKDNGATVTGWNFSGPCGPLHLFGEYPALDFLGYVPRLKSDAAIGATIFSYNGTIQYSLSIDWALFTHRESALKLARLTEKEFLSLQNLPININNCNADSNDKSQFHNSFR